MLSGRDWTGLGSNPAFARVLGVTLVGTQFRGHDDMYGANLF